MNVQCRMHKLSSNNSLVLPGSSEQAQRVRRSQAHPQTHLGHLSFSTADTSVLSTYEIYAQKDILVKPSRHTRKPFSRLLGLREMEKNEKNGGKFTADTQPKTMCWSPNMMPLPKDTDWGWSKSVEINIVNLRNYPECFHTKLILDPCLRLQANSLLVSL